MVDRSLTFYEGEDLSPSWDVTDLVKWEEAEFGTRAWRGESTNTDIPFRDEQSRTSHADNLPAGLQKIVFQARNTLEFVHGSNVLWRGRIANQSYTRGAQKAGRAREGAAYLEDINIDLRGIVVHGWSRPAETDVARLHGLIASYLSGSPRRSTIVNGSNLINAGSNVITLPAKVYNQTDPRAVIEDVATQANKTYYLLPRRRTTDAHTAELFYDGNDAVMELCPFRISDHPDEVKAEPDTVFAPIWNVGAAGELAAQETLSGVWLFYGQESYVHVADSGVADITAHWEEVIYDDTVTTEAEATSKANAIIQFRRSSTRRINVTIGPLGDQHIDSIRAGQRITIQAMAVPWADDQRYDANIGQLKITTPLPGIYFAHLELERPLRMGPYGQGEKVGPKPAEPTVPPGEPTGGTPSLTVTWTYEDADNLDTSDTYTFMVTTRSDPYALSGTWGHNGGSDDHESTPRFACSAGQRVTVVGDFARQLASSLQAYSMEVRWYLSDASVNPSSTVTLPIPASGSGLGVAAHIDTTLIVPASITRFALWIGDNVFGDNIQVQVLGSPTAGTAGTEGQGDPDLVGDDADHYSLADHSHIVLRDGPPTATDDLEHGYPTRTTWKVVDDLATPTQILAIYESLDSTNGAAVWAIDGINISSGDELISGVNEIHFTGATVTDNSDGTVAVTVDSFDSDVFDHGNFGAAETIDLTDSKAHTGILDSNCTFTFAGAASAVEERFRLYMRQDSTGSRVPTFPSSVVWPNDTEPSWSTDPDAVDVIEFTTIDGGVTWYGDAGGGASVAAAASERRILLADGHATPFTFNDMLQMDDGSDFMWSD